MRCGWIALISFCSSAALAPPRCQTRSDGASPRPYQAQASTTIRLQWDPWTSSQLITAIAGILLQEELGFTVEFVRTPANSRDLYSAVSQGVVHAAMEIWPSGASGQVAKNTTDGRIKSIDYARLLGRYGIYETCDRMGSGHGACRLDASGLATPLPAALRTPEGRSHFSQIGSHDVSIAHNAPCLSPTPPPGVARCDPDGVWRPPRCASGGCVQLKRVSADFDSDLLTSLILELDLPIEVWT